MSVAKWLPSLLIAVSLAKTGVEPAVTVNGVFLPVGAVGKTVTDEVSLWRVTFCCRAALIDKNRQRCVFSSFSFYSATEMALNRKKSGTQT